MSYDISLTVDTGGPEPATLDLWWNYTSNCASMWRAAGADLAGFAGRQAGDCAVELAAAVTLMRDEPGRFQAMDPPNGWGSYAGLLPALDRLLEAFLAHPKATVRVSR